MEIKIISVAVVSFAVGIGVGIATALGLMRYSIIKALSYGDDWMFMGEDFLLRRMRKSDIPQTINKNRSIATPDNPLGLERRKS